MRRRNFLSLLLAPGWPETEVETLAGRKVMIPAVFGGKPAVVVWSFSKGAGEKTRDWLEPLTKTGNQCLGRGDAGSCSAVRAAPDSRRHEKSR